MSDKTRISPPCHLPHRLGAAAAFVMLFALPALSNPTNPVVVNGSASFSQTGKVLTVTNSNGAIINWDKFSIQTGETTRFAQPSASSAVLNRVLNDPTSIYGTLSSNGRVWLVNPAGILVGPGGRVDTAGFVASTLGVSTQDFLAGRKLFEGVPGAGNVFNQGEIRTPVGGSVYLIGSNVGNEGIITTPKGETILAAGAKVSLVDTATPGVKVEITGAAGNSTNLGDIAAEAGRIGIAGVVVRNSGKLNASSVVSDGGRVFLKASQDTFVEGDAQVTATGTRGGKVEVLGKRVAVTDRAVVDASGTKGGGSILVGGDYQGKNPAIQNAQVSYFGKDATLKADATGAGTGGKVIVWADDTTRAYGNIFARGGAKGGNGGFVETSGKRYLDVNGIRVDTRAPKGQAGTWLLDPTDIYIAVDVATANGATPPMIGGDISVGATGPALFQTGGAPNHSLLTTATLQGALGLGNVEVNTTSGGGAPGDILVVSPVTWATLNTLKLNATSSINVGADITGTAGQLSLLAGMGITNNVGAGKIKVDKLEARAGGGVSLAGQNEIKTFAADATSGMVGLETRESSGLTIGTVGITTGVSAYGPVDIKQYVAGGISVTKDVSATNGGITLGIASGPGGISFGGVGARTLSGPNIQAYTSGGAITQSSAVTFTSPTTSMHTATGAITLNNPGNNFTGSLDIPNGGVVQIKDMDGLALGPITSGLLNVVAVGPLNVNGAINTSAGGGVIDLTGNNITFVAAGTLSAGTGAINIASSGANANTSIPAGVTMSGSDINIKSDKLDVVAGAAALTATTGAVNITRFSPGGNIQVGEPAGGTDGAGILAIGGAEIATFSSPRFRFGDAAVNIMTIEGPVNVGASTLRLEAGGGGITNVAGKITAGGLAAVSTGPVNFDTVAHDAGTIAASVTGVTTNYFKYRGATGVNVGSVDGVSGIATPVGGAYVAGSINGVIGLRAVTGNITQSATGVLAGAAVYADAIAGLVNLTTASNPTGVIAGNAPSGFAYKSVNPIQVTNVAGGLGGKVGIVAIGSTANLESPSGIATSGATIKASSVILTAGDGVNVALTDVGTINVANGSGTPATKGTIISSNSTGNLPLSATINQLASPPSALTDISLSHNGEIIAAGTGITSDGGNILVSSTGPIGSNASKVTATLASPIQTQNAGRVVIEADEIGLSGAGSGAIATGVTNGTVSIKPFSATSAWKIVGAPSSCASFPGVPCYDSASLQKVTAKGLYLGATDGSVTGDLDIQEAATFTTVMTGLGTSGKISKGNTSVITADKLAVVAGGSIELGEALQANNSVNELAATANGVKLTFKNGKTLLIPSSMLDPQGVNIAGVMAPAATGAITLSAATGNLTIGAPITANATNGSITLSAAGASGAISNGGGLISGQTLGLTADSGIGSGSPLLTQVASLSATNTTANSIEINNTGILTITSMSSPGAVAVDNIGGITTSGAISSTGAGVTLTAHSPLTVNAPINGFTTISLTAGGPVWTAGKTGDDLTINGPVAISGPSGTITLNAGNAIGGTQVPVTAGAKVVVSNPNLNTPVPSLATCIAAPLTAGCAAVLPTLATCTATPSTPGCVAVLPTLAVCTATPSTPGCSAVLPTLAVCTATPATPGCTAVLPTLAVCTTTPTTPGCTAVLPTLATCTATPATPGCTAVLPTLAVCTATPATPGCTAVLPTLAVCTATPATPGCTAVLPTLAVCTANPTTPGCSAVIPTLATCTATPSTPGCSLVLPSLATCVASPSTTGCSAVLPTIATCTATPSTPGCAVVLPKLATCISAPSTAGCSAVLPSVDSCAATPTLPGCSAVLPTVASCVSDPAQAGCTAVLPTVASCASDPSLPGCSAVLPTLAQCASNATLAGCTAVLPSVASCAANPGAEGCTAVLPSLATCSTTPSLAGCSAVLPTLAACTATPSLPGCTATLSLVTKPNTSTTTTNNVQTATDGAKNLGKDTSTNPVGEKLALLDTGGGDQSDSGQPRLGSFGDDSSLGGGQSGGGQSGGGSDSSSSGNSAGGSNSGNANNKEDEGTNPKDEKAKKTSNAKQEKKDAKVAVKKIYCN